MLPGHDHLKGDHKWARRSARRMSQPMDADARKQLLQAINRMQMARNFLEQAIAAANNAGLLSFLPDGGDYCTDWTSHMNDALVDMDAAMADGHTLWQASHDAER